MRKNLFKVISPLLLTVLFFYACQKAAKDLKNEKETTTNATGSNQNGSCRVTQYSYYDVARDYAQIDNYTYKNGLVDEWAPYYGTVYKMEYGTNKKMKTARQYYGDQLLYTVDFIYKNNKIVKEIWYTGNTQDIADEVTNTYNEKGQLIKNQSLNGNYYTLNTYTPMGDLESWLLFFGGQPIQKGVYTYNKEIKNPLNSGRPGIEYSFAWTNSAFGAGNRWYTSEKIIFYDGNGDPFTYYDQDPNKTKWVIAEQNYPLRADYIDALSGGTVINSFEYENCGPAQNLNSALKQQQIITDPKQLINPANRLFHGASPEVIEKLQQLRLHKTTK